MKQFTYIEKIRWTFRAKKFGLENVLQDFILKYKHRYVNTYGEVTLQNKRIAISRLKAWLNKYNTYGMKILKSKSGKTGNKTKKRKIKISDLTPNDQKIYHDIVDEIFKDHGISKKEIIDKLRKRKEKSKLSNISLLSLLFNISRKSLYYKVKGRRYRTIKQETKDLVQKAHIDNKNVYGYMKINKTFKNKGIDMSTWKVRKAYEELNLKSIRNKTKIKKIKEIKNTNVKDFNIPNGDFKAEKPNKYWFTDVSYIKAKSKFYYLSIIVDSFNNEIVDWQLSDKHNVKLVIENMRNAYNKKGRFSDVFHSDHGFEYTRNEHITLLKKFNSKRSLSKIGCSLDNRPAEFGFSLIKREFLNHKSFSSIDEYKILINEYVEWYNNDRIQSVLEWKSPRQYLDNYIRT